MIDPIGQKSFLNGRLFPRAVLWVMWVVFSGFICLGLFWTCAIEAAETGQDKDIRTLFPNREIPSGWRPVGEPRIYAGRELYEYINGGADLYLEYGFKEAASLEYLGPDDAVIVVDIYRMSSSAAAYGIFSAGRRMDHASMDLGTAASQTPYQRTFCKGEFFINVQNLGAGGEENVASEYLAREVDVSLFNADTVVPKIVQKLPREYLIPQSITLAHGPLSLNSRRYLGDRNFFELGGDTWGVIGLYSFPGDEEPPAVLLFVEYPDSTATGRIKKKLLGHIENPADKTSSSLAEFPSFWRTENIWLAAWFDLSLEKRSLAEKLLREVLK